MERILVHDHHQDIIINPNFELYNRKEYLEYRRNWKGHPGRRIVSNFPINLDIYVTNRCNLRCIMCDRTKRKEQGEKKILQDLDFELYKQLIDEATREGVCAVHLTADGEPLLHKNIIEMIEYGRRKNVLDLFMHTNATLLNKEMSLAILKAGLTRLIISFDSPVKETYEKIRVGTKFEKVLNNIRTFAEMKKDYEYPILRVQMVKMKINHTESVKYEKMFRPFVDVIGFTNYVNYFDRGDGGLDYKEKKYRENHVCNAIWRRMTVDVDGGVYGCGLTQPQMYLGKAYDKPLKEFWQGEKMTEIRRLYEEMNVERLKTICTCGRQWK